MSGFERRLAPEDRLDIRLSAKLAFTPGATSTTVDGGGSCVVDPRLMLPVDSGGQLLCTGGWEPQQGCGYRNDRWLSFSQNRRARRAWNLADRRKDPCSPQWWRKWQPPPLRSLGLDN